MVDLPALPVIAIDIHTLIDIALVIGTASGWIALWLELLSQRPKIVGRILNVISGKLLPDANKPTEWIAIFVVLLYLTNTHKNAVHMIDFDFEVDIGNGFDKMRHMLGLKEMENFTFEQWKSRGLEIPDFKNKLFSLRENPVKFGSPLRGILMFGGDIKYYNIGYDKLRRFRITCTDVFGKKHRILGKPIEFPPIAELEYIFDVKQMPEKS